MCVHNGIMCSDWMGWILLLMCIDGIVITPNVVDIVDTWSILQVCHWLGDVHMSCSLKQINIIAKAIWIMKWVSSSCVCVCVCVFNMSFYQLYSVETSTNLIQIWWKYFILAEVHITIFHHQYFKENLRKPIFVHSKPCNLKSIN